MMDVSQVPIQGTLLFNIFLYDLPLYIDILELCNYVDITCNRWG